MSIIICENCNSENEYGRKYCENCGYELFYNEESLQDEEIEDINIEKDDAYWEKHKAIILTTTNELRGYEIEEYIDVISKEMIMGIGIGTDLKKFKDVFASFTGSEYRAYGERLEEIKYKLKDKIKEEAIKLGGNAVIGMDFESSAFSNSAMRVSASGTVVKIKKGKQ